MSSKRQRNKVKDVMLNVMTNTPNEHLFSTLEMLYKEAYANNVGLMVAKRKDNSELELILVKTAMEKGKLVSYPMARLLSGTEANNYLAPDGRGGYVGETVDEPADSN